MMKSNFLNLPSSAAGDARRHVPFRSIINKHFSILFVLVFVFSIIFSYIHPVAALADPVFQPVYDTQFYQLPQFVDPLNSTQQDIFYFILGSQVVEYAGLSDYQIENPYSDPDSVGDWFKKIGYDLYNDVLESFVIAGAPVIAGAKWLKDLYSNIAGAANFAGAFNNSSWNDWYSNVQTNGLSLELYPVMFGALNQYFAYNNGLYDWQFNEDTFVSENFVWRELPLGAYQSDWLSLAMTLTIPYVKVNRYDTVNNNKYYNMVFSQPTTYEPVLFFNSNGYFNLVDGYTGVAPEKAFDQGVVAVFRGSYNEFQRVEYTGYWNNRISGYVDYSQYNNISDAIQYVYNHQINSVDYKLDDFIKHVYYGDSWDSRVEVVRTSDLNFEPNSSQDTLTPVINTLLDIKGLISDLIEQNELKQPSIDNLTDLNGDPLSVSQLQPVSVAVELPDSGITINSGLFNPLTKNGGYIDYLWYMTKPLVQYTSDFVQTLVFPDDTGEGFDVTGPGAIVFGVISLGLIGGLVVKCLL